MPNVNAVLNLQIRRLARREITAGIRPVKKAAGHYRREIAALKREVAQLNKAVGELKKQVPEQPLPLAPPEALQKARLRIDGLKAHRQRLGLSAKDYGKLIGVGALTIYNWEAGKSKPRRSQLPRIVAVRGIGKREALRRLGRGSAEGELPGGQAILDLLGRPKAGYPAKVPPQLFEALHSLEAALPSAPAKGRRGKRGTFGQTAQEMILGLLKANRTLTTAQINAAWKQAGRKGTADVTLGGMVKDRMLKRTKIKGQRGSEYRAG
jgi:DNA-binding transcriptional regulator YiaG